MSRRLSASGCTRRPVAVLAAMVLGLVAATSAAAKGSGGEQAESIVGFQIRSGNIICASYQGELRCDLSRGLTPRPRRPRGCPWDMDFGQGVELSGTGTARVVCAGDTVFGSRFRVLPYGSTWRRDGIACRSRTTGLTCTNAAGRGFFLSRERWRIF